MSLDQLARSATSEVRTTAAARDAAALRHDLDRRLARHRRHTVALALALVLAVVLGGVAVAASSRSSSAPPVAPRPTPTPALLSGNGPLVVSVGRAVVAVDPVTRTSVHGLALPPYGQDVLTRSWSPDGTRLLEGGTSALSVWDVRTHQARTVLTCPTGCFGSWSPDGRAIALSSGRGIEVVDVASGARRTVTTATSGLHGAAVWSPVGDLIAFVDETPPANTLVVLRAGDGSAVARVGLGSGQRFYLLAWSPDGSRIALLSEVGTANGTDHPLAVDLVPVSGGAFGPARRLRTVGHCFCIGFAPGIGWSPDGRQLAVDAIGVPAPGGDGTNVMNADGTGLRLVVAGTNGQPAWQPVPR